MNPTGSSEASQSVPETEGPIVFQCPRCRTTLRLDRSLAGTTANCESCQNLIRVPRPRTPKKIPTKAEAAAQEPIEELERRLKENDSQRTEITGYINKGSIQLHRWQLQLQTLNERKQQLEAEIASRKA